MYLFVRYACPTCKTKSQGSQKVCKKCGQWVLDSVREPKQAGKPLKLMTNLLKTVTLGFASLVLLGVLRTLV